MQTRSKCSSIVKLTQGRHSEFQKWPETVFSKDHVKSRLRQSGCHPSVKETSNDNTIFELTQYCFYSEGSIPWRLHRFGTLSNRSGSPLCRLCLLFAQQVWEWAQHLTSFGPTGRFLLQGWSVRSHLDLLPASWHRERAVMPCIQQTEPVTFPGSRNLVRECWSACQSGCLPRSASSVAGLRSFSSKMREDWTGETNWTSWNAKQLLLWGQGKNGHSWLHHPTGPRPEGWSWTTHVVNAKKGYRNLQSSKVRVMRKEP